MKAFAYSKDYAYFYSGDSKEDAVLLVRCLIAKRAILSRNAKKYGNICRIFVTS